MTWTCNECEERFLFDAPSKWQPDVDEDEDPVCSDCRDLNS